ncbi:MAG: hypothetical protein JWP38_786 [Herbaspirillum sp.]|jgi:membrane-associated phospholipid phosphatase|nr:hypothetical protein [Herbaspirillum sp.]
MFSWSSITYLGDSALTVPCAAALIGWLAIVGKWGAAVRWALVFGAGMALVVVTKLAFLGWDIGVHSINFTGISGHSASSMALLPVLVFLLSAGWPRPIRKTLVGATLIGVVLIGMSRLVLRVHSEAEVMAGLTLGACMSLYFIGRSGLGERVIPGRPIMLLTLVVLTSLPGGQPAPTQSWLEHLALTLSGHEQVHTRHVAL